MSTLVPGHVEEGKHLCGVIAPVSARVLMNDHRVVGHTVTNVVVMAVAQNDIFQGPFLFIKGTNLK